MLLSVEWQGERRRLSEEDHIVLFERGEYISFANCGLLYYIGGVIEKRDKLLVQTADGMAKRFRIDVRTLSEVTAIHRDRKTVSVRNRETGEEYEETYDMLILSPGAKPIVPPIPGIEEAEALFTLRTVPDTDRIKAYIDEQTPRRAVVIGGGFIGVEMVENLVRRGIKVILVERANQVMAPMDYEMAAMVHDHMREHGVELLLEEGVQALEERGRRVVLASGRAIETDMIILAIGVQPESGLAKEAGLELGVRGTIKVNEHLQTSDLSIYAIGDAVEVRHYIHGFETFVPLAWPANRQGRLVADHIHGFDAKYSGTLGTSIAKVFELAVAATGLNEKTLRSLGLPYEAIHLHPLSHAGYYPHAAPMTFKLIFDRNSGRIYGAQAVGKEGVDKRIDVIATAIKGGLTVRDLPDLELAYAPPFSLAKDPVNMAGYVASNIMDGLVETVSWHEIDHIVAKGGVLIDVRTKEEIKQGIVPGSIHVPLDELRDRLQELPKEKDIYVICQAGLRGYIAVRILRQHGFRAINVDGGYRLYAVAKQ
ncbi:CoA-disulfide reductase [Geobacillus thermodenitrificans]|nr:CoA-disulfide reductase [Geobacillus thermodenitrificans]